MSGNDINELIGYLQQDIPSLLDGIEQNEPQLKKILDLIKSAKIFFSTNFWGFQVMLRKYCFDNFSQVGINAMIERRDLIERIFYSSLHIDKGKRYFYLSLFDSYLPESHSLMNFLYMAIFERFHTTSKMIKEIFQELLNEWETTMSTSQIKISLMFYLPIKAELGDYKIADDLYFYSKIHHIKIDETIDDPPIGLLNTYHTYDQAYRFYDFKDPADLKPISIQKCYLVYYTQIPIKFEESEFTLYRKARIELHESSELLQRKFQEIINTLYLFGFDFNCGDYVIRLPWWYEFDIEELDKYESRLEYHDGFSKLQIEDFTRLYRDVVQSRIYYEKKFEIITYRFHQIFNRDYLPDIILDANIILEMLFTMGMKQELKFRLSLNGALFLAKNWEEFKRYQKVFDALYNLRSTIVHGGEWGRQIKKYIDKKVFRNQKDIISTIRKIISQILKKIVLLRLQDPGILDKFKEKNYFLELSGLINKNEDS